MADPLMFQPFALRHLEFRNRVWVPPMCQYSAVAEGPEQGVPTNWHLVHWASLARGGAGAVVVEATGVCPEGRISPNCLGLWNDAQEDVFAEYLPIAKSHGARVGVQLAHAGRKASTYPWFRNQRAGTIPVDEGGWTPVAPSPIPFDNEHATPRELTAEEIGRVVEAFASAALRAKRAGFDFVEVHAAHGYLIHEFLSPLSNTRADEYGGSAENRARIAREVVRGIRERVPELPVVVRVSGDEWTPGGFGLEDAAQLVEWLAEDGADMIDASSGGNVPGARIPVGPSYQVGIADRLRRAGLPVGAVGLITSAEQAEGILASGQADVVSIGRAALVNPHLPLTWAHELRAPDVDELVPDQYWRARF